MQTLLVLLLFIAAVAYLGHMLWRSFFMPESGCAKGCGSCPASKLSNLGEEKGR